MKEISIAEWVMNFTAGMYDSKAVGTQIEAGWFDWFCSDTALAAKTQFLGHKLLSILGSKKFDIDKTYVWFKNNCPSVGPLYDDFRIADIETGDVIFTIQHLNKGSHGSEKAHWEVYGRENEFKEPIVNGSWNDVKKFFLGNDIPVCPSESSNDTDSEIYQAIASFLDEIHRIITTDRESLEYYGEEIRDTQQSALRLRDALIHPRQRRIGLSQGDLDELN